MSDDSLHIGISSLSGGGYIENSKIQSWALAVFFVGFKKIKSIYFFKTSSLLTISALVLFKKPTSSQINYN